jgi:hypothetical protein
MGYSFVVERALGEKTGAIRIDMTSYGFSVDSENHEYGGGGCGGSCGGEKGAELRPFTCGGIWIPRKFIVAGFVEKSSTDTRASHDHSEAAREQLTAICGQGNPLRIFLGRCFCRNSWPGRRMESGLHLLAENPFWPLRARSSSTRAVRLRSP